VTEGTGGGREREGLTRFPDDVALEDVVVLDDGRGQVVAYPALVDAGDHVDVRLLPTQSEQHRANARGYARLALLSVGQSARHLKKRADREHELGLHFATLGTAAELQDALLRGAAWYCFFEGRPLPATAAEFTERVNACKRELTAVFEATLTAMREILARRFEVARTLERLSSPAFAEAVADAQAQLARLVPADLLAVTPRAWLAEIPRYLDALAYRFEHLQGKVHKDREAIAVAQSFEVRLAALNAASGVAESGVSRLRFAVEELRVALFAAPLGTRGKVSAKRLDREFLEQERDLGLA
jgi:ATP-dependent helicase HrpA